jgi:hypothetical protein
VHGQHAATEHAAPDHEQSDADDLVVLTCTAAVVERADDASAVPASACPADRDDLGLR